MRFRKLLAIACLTALPGFVAAAEAPGGIYGPRFGLQIGVEDFTWTEKDPAQPARELLEENGPRFTAVLSLDNFADPEMGLVYGFKARGYYGSVDYDGETNSGVDLRTEVDYAGGLGELSLGYRHIPDWAGYGFDVLGGLGGEYWSRDIQDGLDANGNPARGYEEVYTVAYAKAGLGVADLTHAEWFGRLEAGVRYPLEVDERIDEFDADLSPGSSVSFYAEYELSKRTAGGNQVGVTLYYEGYRFEESPPASSSIGNVVQPESNMDLFGIRFGVFL